MSQKTTQNTQNTQEQSQEKLAYNPQAIESKIYSICKNRGYFEIDGNADLAQKRQERLRNEQKNGEKINPKDTHFCIMMPPPNVTGVLHIGHALTLSLQDIIVRFRRMQGYTTLYQPGLDHAGIATQNVVEKRLLAQGIKKEHLGREEFIKKVWEWKEESGGKILGQMEALGISPALFRTRFTMDKGLQQAVREAFVAWYEKGLIYEGDYMVNWCTHDGALSDIEVQYEAQETKLYHIAYKLKDSAKSTLDALVVATTRPETFFGDVAVMINPQDSRYSHLIGQKVILPLLEKEIPIIADSAVDMEFGTGVVKVTPAHDINDYEVGKRHGLENLVIFDEKGIFNQNAQGFVGRERLEAREDIVAALDSCGALLKTEAYQNQVGTCYRCGNLIEPYISKQWFVSKQVASGAIKRVNDGEARFYPNAWLNNFNAWMRELRPWCISRQLWWGHRIPIWDCQNPKCAHRFASKNEVESSCPKCGAEVVQVEDVLDTWFSSGLWAFSTLGWGNTNSDSSLGMQCDKILDFLECKQSADISKNPKNLHSHTSPNGLRAERSKNTRIVGENGGEDSSYCVIASDSDRGTSPQLQSSDLACKREWAQLRKQNPLFNNNKIDCHANADAFARNDEIDSPSPSYQNVVEVATNDKKNPPSLAEEARGRAKSTTNDFSTPYNADDLSNFYPNSLLITGFDILFFWVARMLFSGESLLGKLPFRDIYLHALVRDENGQKMSKSRGNVIDPLEMIEKYGADSLRFSLAYLCAQGRDIRLSSAQLEISKNFANKLFNATQFLLLYARQMDSSFKGFCEIATLAQYKTPLGRYAKSRLDLATSELINALESYRFNDGASVLYRFLWGEFCDWCIELAKAQKEAISELGAVLIDALKLLHPYMPFISEELYHSLKGQTLEDAQSIMIAEFPSDIARDLEIEAEFEAIKNAVICLRRLKASVDLANKPIEKAYIEFDKSAKEGIKEAQKATLESIQKLARVESVLIFDNAKIDAKNCVVDIGEGVKCYLPLDNIDLAPILARLDAQKQKLQKEREKLESNLKNDKFLSNAPKEVVEKLESNRKEVLEKLEKVQNEINALNRG